MTLEECLVNFDDVMKTPYRIYKELPPEKKEEARRRLYELHDILDALPPEERARYVRAFSVYN